MLTMETTSEMIEEWKQLFGTHHANMYLIENQG